MERRWLEDEKRAGRLCACVLFFFDMFQPPILPRKVFFCFVKLEALGITHVLSMTDMDVMLSGGRISHKHIRVEDDESEDLGGKLSEALEFMSLATGVTLDRPISGAVLVHCEAGISRSASTVIAYLVKYHSMPLETAFRHVKARRSVICPNSGFVEQLRLFEASHRDVSSQDPFGFILFWLRNFVPALKDVSEDEARQAWLISDHDLNRTWQILFDSYEQKYLIPALSRHIKIPSDDLDD